MRAFLCAAFVLTLAAVSSQGQGYLSISTPAHGIQYRNYPNSAIDLPGGIGYVQLLYAPPGSPATPWPLWAGGPNLQRWLSESPAWEIATGPILVKSTGRLLNAGVELPTTSPVDVRLIGWTGTSTTFDQAWSLAIYPGYVGVGVTDVLHDILPAAIPSPPTPVRFSELTLVCPLVMPEPSSATLAGLGALAALLLRKRPTSGQRR